MTGEQRLVALSAIGFLVEPRSWHPVDGMAAGTNKVQGIAHENSLSDGQGKILPHLLILRVPRS